MWFQKVNYGKTQRDMQLIKGGFKIHGRWETRSFSMYLDGIYKEKQEGEEKRQKDVKSQISGKL